MNHSMGGGFIRIFGDRKYDINANLGRAIEHLYDKAISAVLMNGSRRSSLTHPLQCFSRTDHV